MEGFPMRSWSIEIFLLDEQGQEVAANVFEKATYNLHPSFEKNKQGGFTPARHQISADHPNSLQEASVPH